MKRFFVVTTKQSQVVGMASIDLPDDEELASRLTWGYNPLPLREENGRQ